nr:Pol polyprotein [Tanacetum cinerariifolium]
MTRKAKGVGIVKQKFQRTCYNCDQPGHRATNCKMSNNPKGKGKDKRKNDKKSKRKSEYLASKAEIVKQKFHGTCYNCDQAGHHAANCKMPKRVNLRKPGRAVDNGQNLYMGNSAIADIKGEGDVALKMTSEKELKLMNVLYVLEIRKDLVSDWLLNKFDFRLVFESDKFVLSKNQMYVGRGYAMNGMFKFNVRVVKNEINKMNSSAYLIESSNVWHDRLGHVNFNSMHRLIKFNSIPNFHIDSKYKCETCVEAKLTRTSFKSVKRKTKPLDMVDTDICDLKSLPTKGGNKYFITFIDDCTKHCYVYLLKSKNEAIDKFVLYKTEVESQLGMKIKQNGIAERKNRTLKEMVIAMLISSGMSHDMWGQCCKTRMILAIDALRNLKIHQMDVKTAFLNEDLEEEIYMNQLEGFIAPRQEGKVCRLVKSLYGLKQAPKQWHQKFDHAMLESGFKINEYDKCVYVKDTSSGYVILCLYVDDMLIVGSNDKMIKSTKDMQKSKFSMKDMGLADVILGIKILRTQNGLVLS